MRCIQPLLLSSIITPAREVWLRKANQGFCSQDSQVWPQWPNPLVTQGFAADRPLPHLSLAKSPDAAGCYLPFSSWTWCPPLSVCASETFGCDICHWDLIEHTCMACETSQVIPYCTFWYILITKCARKDTRTQIQYDHDKYFQSFAGWMRLRFWPACRKPCTSRLYSWQGSLSRWKMQCWCGNENFSQRAYRGLPSTYRVSTVQYCYSQDSMCPIG